MLTISVQMNKMKEIYSTSIIFFKNLNYKSAQII